MTWAQGQATIHAMLADGQLQQVPASRTHADLLLAQAHAHLAAAQAIQDADPTGAYALLYDAARKALVGMLENQGLRPTRRGGHIAAYEAVRAQLDPPLGALTRGQSPPAPCRPAGSPRIPSGHRHSGLRNGLPPVPQNHDPHPTAFPAPTIRCAC